MPHVAPVPSPSNTMDDFCTLGAQVDNMRGRDKVLPSFILKLKQGFPLPESLLQSFLNKNCDVEHGRSVHCTVCVSQSTSTWLQHSLIRLFASSKALLEANLVFCHVHEPNIRTWQAIISAYQTCGENVAAVHLYHCMISAGTQPNSFIFSCVLRTCTMLGDLKEGMGIHEHAIRNGSDSDVYVGSALIDLYAKCQNLEDAQRVFDRLHIRNVVSWNALISGYVLNGFSHIALQLFGNMQVGDAMEPNKVTYLCSLKACSQVGDVMQGKAVHHMILYERVDTDTVIGNALIDMYSKCGTLDEAGAVLNNLLNRNVVSWSAIIKAAAWQHGSDSSMFYRVYEQMQQECVTLDRVAMIALLNACCYTKEIQHGQVIHDQIIKKGTNADLVARGALIDMYMKCGRFEEAQNVFDEVSYPTIVLWGAMISGYSKHGKNHLALELFKKMQDTGTSPDRFLFSTLIKICSRLGALEQGKTFHNEMIRSRIDPDIAIGNAMISMHVRCGELLEAGRIFNKLPCRDATSWSLMITIHALCGDKRSAIQCLNDMEQHGIKPNEMVYARLISSCSHTGEVNEGQLQPNVINQTQSIGSSNKHFTCMLKLLGCIGQLEAARSLLQTMPSHPNLINWMSLLTGCRQHGNTKLGQHCLYQIAKIDPHSAPGYVPLSNMCSQPHPLMPFTDTLGNQS